MFANLKEHFNYPRFAKKPYKVLVINTGYFLLKEFSSAMVEKGHKVRQVQFYDQTPSHPFFKPESPKARIGFLEDFLMIAVDFQPDFVFTVNMLGFDTGGELLGILDNLNLQVLNWFVDTPLGVLTDDAKADFSNILSLCWEKDFIKPFRYRFFNHRIEYMPYGTMLSGRERLGNSNFKNDIAFVGSSMHFGVETWELKTRVKPQLKELFIDFTRDKLYKLHESVTDFFLEYQIYDQQVQTYFYFLGSKLFRESMATELSCKNNFAVYGDNDWNLAKIKGLKIFPSLNYYRETPQLFHNTTININITSPQMTTAVNQRVFDIPASGGFLLTDYRSDLGELFDSYELVTFKSKQELNDLTDFYLKHENLRKDKADRLKKFVLANHRYVNRLDDIFLLLVEI